MAEVVDEARVGAVAVLLEARQLGDLVRDRGVAHRHEIEVVPEPALVVGEALVHPQGHLAVDEVARDEVELEDVGQLVGDQALQAVGRLVDGDHHPVARGLREGGHPFGHEPPEEVGLLELRVRLVEDDRDGEVDLVLEVGRDLLVPALRVGHDPGEVLLELGVVVHLEVRALVDPPREVVVVDLVLPVVRDELRVGLCRAERDEQRDGRQARGPEAGGHGVTYLSRTRVPRIFWGEMTPRKLGRSRSMSSKYDERGDTFWSSP